MKKSYIYIIGNNDKSELKIGYTSNTKSRLGTLQTGRTDKLNIYYEAEVPSDKVRYIESKIHHNLNHVRINKEWFKGDLNRFINEIDHAIIRYIDDINPI